MARPKVKGDVKALNLNIDAKLYNEVDKYSLKTGVPKTAITEKALNEYLLNIKKQSKEKE